MDFDWSSQQVPPPPELETDPIKLFSSLQVLDSGINDLWLGQGDALREWNKNRAKDDTAIVLNTGAGKTLVGLLIAQSLVNETRGHIVYTCASLQLVEQTAQKAQSYGLDVSTYIGGGTGFNNSRYQEGLAPCITTYQALFNGLTRRWDDANSIIFDDAHTATHIIRSQFTLSIDRNTYPNIHNALTSAFAEHLRATGSDVAFRQAIETDDPRSRWFIPPFIVRRNSGELNQAFIEARLHEDDQQKYVWGYIKDKIHLCSVFLSTRTAWFTPPVIPVRTLPYFRQGVRRVYLSATLTADDAFLRTFGKIADTVIAPESPAGNCERMILFPKMSEGAEDDLALTKSVISPHKTLVLVPTHRDRREWDDCIDENLLTDPTTQVEQFKLEDPPAKILLVARYDGVDLPGDTCRMMVIHGLPSHLDPLERFKWETLGVHNVLRSTIASRIVQSFGRISRGMADHGVIILIGSAIIEWLMTHSNRLALPAFLRRQIDIGLELSKSVKVDQLVSLAGQCLVQNPGWRDHYSRSMVDFDDSDETTTTDLLADAARIEAEFGQHYWNCDYERAIRAIQEGRDTLFTASKGIGAWYLLWKGYSHDLLNDHESAIDCYKQARRAEKSLPVLRTEPTVEAKDDPDSKQIEEVVSFLRGTGDTIARFDRETAALCSGSSAQIEEATRCLGSYIGLDSSRPDNSVGTGPDVLWYVPNQAAWSFELKTDMEPTGTYPKKYVAQAADHVRWVQRTKNADPIIPAIVGPLLPADSRANPPDDLIIVEPNALVLLRDRIRPALETLVSYPLPLYLHSEVKRVFREAGLLWSSLSSSPPGIALTAIDTESAST